MHCTYEEVLETPMPIVQLYLELMAAETAAGKDKTKRPKK